MTTKRRFVIYIAIALISILILEGAARSIQWSPEQYVDTGTPRQGFSEQGIGDWVPNQDAVWIDVITHPMYVHINKSGFRNIEELHQERYRVLALGDSQTFGLFVSSHDIWTRVAQRLINLNAERKIEILNNGIPGTTIVDHLAYLREKGKRLSPDLILLVINTNDLQDLRQLGTSIGSTREDMRAHARDAAQNFYDLRRFFIDNFAIYALARSVRDYFRRARAASEMRELTPPDQYRETILTDAESTPLDLAIGKDKPRLVANYKYMFEQTLAEAQKLKARIAVVYMPDHVRIDDPISGYSTRQIALDLVARHDTPFLDLLSAFAEHDRTALFLVDPAEQDTNYASDGHLSRYGHSVVSRAVASFLLGLIQQ